MSTVKRLLLTDYGGVLADHHQEPAESTLATKLGVSVLRCRELLSERSVQGMAVREGKLTEREFWCTVLDLARNDGKQSFDHRALTQLWAETYRLNPVVLSMLVASRGPDTLIGVLTNIDAGRSDYLVTAIHITEVVDIYLPSFAFGAIKPKTELWEAADAAIRRIVGDVEITYVDDRAGHVQACSVSGWRGLHYSGIDQLRIDLERAGYLKPIVQPMNVE